MLCMYIFLYFHADNLGVTTSILVTSSEQLFSWQEYGLSLYIPENSLPDNLQQCSIHIKATIVGDYQLPQDTHLVSAVYWIECVPKCRFSVPLTLELQHCAKLDCISELCFIKADLEENSVFQIVASDCEHLTQTFFPSSSSYGLIELNTFSGYGVAKKGSNQRSYRSLVYYREENFRHLEIHFVISWNTNAHKKVCWLALGGCHVNIIYVETADYRRVL